MGTPIPSSSLTFTTRQYYVENTPNTAKDDTLTFGDLDKTLLFLSSSITSIEGTYSSSFSNNTTTPKAVGGINSGSTAGSLRGNTFSKMFDLLLFPVINPTPTVGTFSSTTGFIYKEIGDIISVTVTSTFSKGVWQVTGQSPRFYYGDATNFYFSSSTVSEINNSANNQYIFTSYTVTDGTNNFPTAVSHSIGQQPINSDGSNFSNPVPAGKLTYADVSFEGIYPWFYGSSSAATFSVADIVTAIQSLYGGSPSTNTVKSVTPSTGTITGLFYGSSPIWCWFAHPASSTAKTTMYQNNFNTNPINSAGTFNNNGTTNITATGYWNNVSYRIYITNAKTTFDGNPNQYTVQLQN
jgi:hypothetical protein